MQDKLKYLTFGNIFEWSCFSTAILFSLDLDECRSATGLKADWQWLMGAYSITATWLGLFSVISRSPLYGIQAGAPFSDVMSFKALALHFATWVGPQQSEIDSRHH